MNQNLKEGLLLERNYVLYVSGSSTYPDVQSAFEKCQFLRRNFIEEKVCGCLCVSEGGDLQPVRLMNLKCSCPLRVRLSLFSDGYY